jgi:hypothetical protein
VRKLALCASLAVLALAPGASARPQAKAPGVLLSKSYLGVYRLGPSGGLQRLVGKDIHPLAVAADGTAAGIRASDRNQNGPLFLASGTRRVELPHSTGGVPCVAFSADGSKVAYITGKVTLTQPSPNLDYFRIDDTLWLADVAHPDEARAIETGIFVTSECPLPAPTGERFAYVIRAASDLWKLRVYRSGSVGTVAEEQAPVTSNHDRSFAWAPNGTLGFIRGDELWATGRRIATDLTSTLGPRPNIRYGRAIDFSSDGRLIAVSLGQNTAIFRLGGKLVRIVPGHLIEWSGSKGVLTIGVARQTIIVLRRFPFAGPGRTMARFFKLPLVSDPAGRWFAYPVAQAGQFVFRRADGSVIRTRLLWIRSIGVPLAAVDRSGRLSVPAGSY